MRLPTVPEAQQLRQSGQLWPENLTDAELAEELIHARNDSQPVSCQMLRDEESKRRGNRRG